jgi:hypothetical protein
MDDKVLLEMIEEQKQIIERANNQLKKLYLMAEKEGIYVEAKKNYNLNVNSSIMQEIEQQRNEIMKKVEKIKAEAMSQAQMAMASAKNTSGNSFENMGMPNMPSGMGMPMGNIPDFTEMMKSIEKTKTESEEIKKEKENA